MEKKFVVLSGKGNLGEDGFICHDHPLSHGAQAS
jgi:NAD(P)H-hydrate repair Nnr-like enzyme with NAD(P)H-hydrate epimerase domain